MEKSFFILIVLFIFSGCVVDKVSVTNIKKPLRNATTTASSASVSSVKIINHQLVITGSGLDTVTQVQVNGNSLAENFSIETKSATKIIANSLHAFSFDISKVFNLILSDANASASFQIDFALCNATLNGKGFDCSPSIVLQNNDVLSYDAGTKKWKPRAINNLSYLGLLDASGSMPAAGPAGQYYIVSVGGNGFSEGDWAVSNGTTFDQINNATYVTKVFGRTGDIEPEAGDYSLDMLADVNIHPTPGDNGKVLKYDSATGKWILGIDNAGGGASSVTTSVLVDGAVTDAKIDSVSASKITGTINSSQILNGTIVNADISATAAIDYSKLNIPNTSIPYAKLNIADGDIPAAKISGLPAATTVLATSIVDGDTTHSPDGNAVYDALTGKMDLTGGTLVSGTINGIPTPVGPSEAVNKDYVDTQDDLALLKTGGTLSGLLNLDADMRIKGGTNYVTLKAHATTTVYDFVFPQNKGTSGYVLATDGNGNTSWVNVSDSSVQAFAKSALPTCSSGEVLKSNGTSFSCVTDASGAAAFSGTASRAVVTGTGGALEVSATTAAEIGYVNGVTSAIQTQLNGKQAAISTGTTAQYYRGDKSWQTLDTSIVPENTNLYFTEARTIAAPLTGVSSATGVISSSDTILGAFGKMINTQNDYVSKTANSTITGTLTINSIVGALTVPDPVNPADAANKRYVDSYGQWTKSGSDVVRTTGNVGVGTTSPTLGQSLPDNYSMLGVTGNGSASNYSSGIIGVGNNRATATVGDLLGQYTFNSIASSSAQGASIQSYLEGVGGPNGFGARMHFHTKADNGFLVERLRIDSSGNVGIGTNGSAISRLEIAGGSVVGTTASNSGTTINFATGNLQYTTSACGALILQNLKSGGTYTLAVQGAAGGTCSFTAYSDLSVTSLTVKAGSISLVQSANKHALFTFLVMGSNVYLASIDGY